MLASGFYLGTPVVAITQYQMFSQFCIHDQNHMEPRSAGHGYENQYLDTMLWGPVDNNQNEMDQRQSIESIRGITMVWQIFSVCRATHSYWFRAFIL